MPTTPGPRSAALAPLWLASAGLIGALAASALGCQAPEETSPGEPIGEIAQAACGSASGDWSDFPEGDGTLQCVGGVRQFYQKKFKITVPPASGGPVGSCAKYGACNLWVNPANRPDPAKWNRYDWGTKTPQTYDMVVFPPTGSNAYGHVASIDHMKGSKLFVMDANWSPWKGHKAACVHDVGSYKPYGFYRLKSLEKAASCDRSAGGFTFSCDGKQAAMTCVSVNEPADPESWSNDYFCSTLDIGMKWSSAGPIDGMTCTQVGEPSSKYAAAWADNYLCVPPQSPFAFAFSSKGKIAGQSCVEWNEPSAASWSDNFVCSTRVNAFSAGGFTFSSNGPPDGKVCVSVNEPAETDPWSDNYFCSDEDIGMKWSSKGKIAGMTCTSIDEPAEKPASIWADNFLCLPPDAPYQFTWSHAGPIAGKTCVRWFDHAEDGPTWIDNWLCIDPIASGAGGNGAGGSAGSSGQGGAGAAGSTSPPASAGNAGSSGATSAGSAGVAGHAGSAGHAGTSGTSTAGSAGTGAAGHAAGAGVAGAGGAPLLDGAEAETADTTDAGGCSIDPRRPRSRAPLLLGALGLLVARRRRR
jgi:hypothetical protein